MSSGSRFRWLQGLAGLAGLLGALGLVPLGLMALGQGPPHGVASWHGLATGLQRPISDSTLLRGAGLLGWLLWALFAVAVAFEIIGYLAAAGRARPRWAVPGLQSWARTLVLTTALLLPQRGLAIAAVAGNPPPAHVTQPAPATPAAARLQQRYVVRRYDSPWAIAERHLGDGTRWREIRDAIGQSLDTGQRVSGRSPARIIHPGEVLLLPNDGVAVPHPTSAAPRPARAATTARATPTAVEAPEATAPEAAAVGAAGPEAAAPPAAPPTTAAPAAAATAARAPSAAAPSAAGPAATDPAPASPPPTTLHLGTGPAAPASTSPSGISTTSAFAPPIGDAGATRSRRPGSPTSAASATTMISANTGHPTPPGGTASALLEAGLVGAAAVGVVGVLRRRQAQRRPFGKRIRLPGPELTRFELAVHATETPERAILVGQALDLLLGLLAEGALPPPTILGVVAAADMVEVLLDRPAPPPPPWTSCAEGFRWRILATELGPLPARIESTAPLPALTSLGRAAAGNADVLINLEAAGIVGIAGSRDRATGLLHAMATHLRGAPWAEAVQLIVIGFPPSLLPVESVRTVVSVTEIGKELTATAEIMSALVARNGCADAFQARVRGLAGDGWPPVVVLCAEPLTEEELALLSGIAGPGRGVSAVVVHAGAAAHWEIDVDARPVPVQPLRLAVEPTILERADVALLAELERIATDESGAAVTEPPYDQIQLSVDLPDPQLVGSTVPAHEVPPAEVALSLADRLARLGTTARDDQPLVVPAEPEVLVRVLGSVEVNGAHVFKRPKSRELVVYLAMHPNGVGEAELDEALWGSNNGRLVVPTTRDSTVSAARSALGGAARLLPAQGQGREKRYQLGPDVGSDWNLFCILHRRGRDHGSAAALRQALAMVRGRPFEGVVSGRTYGWIHTEGHGRHIEAEVADAADLAARLLLDQGDPLGARWAARKGLLADQFTERLWVRLMEAADQLGESQEIERIMDEMDVVLELEGDFSGLHPNTLAAYDRLSRRHRIAPQDSSTVGGRLAAARQPNGRKSSLS